MIKPPGAGATKANACFVEGALGSRHEFAHNGSFEAEKHGVDVISLPVVFIMSLWTHGISLVEYI